MQLLYDSAIRVIVGLPGHGKSRYLARYLSMVGGLTLTNLDLTPLHPRYADPLMVRIGSSYGFSIAPESGNSDLLQCPRNCTIVIDEADLFFDSSDFARFAREYKLFLKRHRKMQQRIVFAVQNLNNLWIRIRRMAQNFTMCWHDYKTAAWYWEYLPVQVSRFCLAEFGDESLSQRSFLRGSFEWYWQAKQTFQWYDTAQLDFD